MICRENAVPFCFSSVSVLCSLFSPSQTQAIFHPDEVSTILHSDSGLSLSITRNGSLRTSLSVSVGRVADDTDSAPENRIKIIPPN